MARSRGGRRTRMRHCAPTRAQGLYQWSRLRPGLPLGVCPEEAGERGAAATAGAPAQRRRFVKSDPGRGVDLTHRAAVPSRHGRRGLGARLGQSKCPGRMSGAFLLIPCHSAVTVPQDANPGRLRLTSGDG
jgi:hypothetical protein